MIQNVQFLWIKTKLEIRWLHQPCTKPVEAPHATAGWSNVGITRTNPWKVWVANADKELCRNTVEDRFDKSLRFLKRTPIWSLKIMDIPQINGVCTNQFSGLFLLMVEGPQNPGALVISSIFMNFICWKKKNSNPHGLAWKGPLYNRSKTKKDNKNTSSNALCPRNKSHMSFGGNLSKFHLWNDICKRISKYNKLELEHLLCVWAYVSCHVSHAQRLTIKGPKASALLFESGEMAVTLPTAALPSCGFGFTNVKLKS